MDQPQPPSLLPADWAAKLAEARADVAAGRTYDLEAFLRQLDAEDAVIDSQAEADDLEHGDEGPEQHPGPMPSR